MRKAAVVWFGILQISHLEVLSILRKTALSTLDPPLTKICFFLTSPLHMADKHAHLTKHVPPQGLQFYKTALSLQFL